MPYDWVNPYAFSPPIAPHIAAREAGVEISLDLIRERADALAAQADCLIVEGVGGWRVPLGPGSGGQRPAPGLRLAGYPGGRPAPRRYQPCLADRGEHPRQWLPPGRLGRQPGRSGPGAAGGKSCDPLIPDPSPLRSASSPGWGSPQGGWSQRPWPPILPLGKSGLEPMGIGETSTAITPTRISKRHRPSRAQVPCYLKRQGQRGSRV